MNSNVCRVEAFQFHLGENDEVAVLAIAGEKLSAESLRLEESCSESNNSVASSCRKIPWNSETRNTLRGLRRGGTDGLSSVLVRSYLLEPERNGRQQSEHSQDETAREQYLRMVL